MTIPLFHYLSNCPSGARRVLIPGAGWDVSMAHHAEFGVYVILARGCVHMKGYIRGYITVTPILPHWKSHLAPMVVPMCPSEKKNSFHDFSILFELRNVIFGYVKYTSITNILVTIFYILSSGWPLVTFQS